MEEKLDKLISLMEVQNKALNHSLQFLNGMHALMVEKYKSADLLLEKHPPIGAPQAAPKTVLRNPLNTFGDQQPYGYDIEEERKSVPQSFPATVNETEEPQPPQQPFREAPPEVPVTSKAEMMEQAERRDTSSEV